MFCTNCGTPLEDGAKFCTRCGTPVAVAAPQPSTAETETPAYISEMPVYQDQPAPAKKSKKGLIITLAAVGTAILVTVALLLFVFMGGAHRSPEGIVEQYVYAQAANDFEAFVDCFPDFTLMNNFGTTDRQEAIAALKEEFEDSESVEIKRLQITVREQIDADQKAQSDDLNDFITPFQEWLDETARDDLNKISAYALLDVFCIDSDNDEWDVVFICAQYDGAWYVIATGY